MPDGLPVPHNLAVASRRAQLASIVHTVTRQRGGARVINAYDSRYGADRGHLEAAELQGSFQRLEEVTEPLTSIFYFVDDPRLVLDVALDELRREVARLRATAVRHWLAIQAGQHRVNTADLAELQQTAYRGGWQLNAVWSTALPGQCRTHMVEANSDDDTVQGVDLNPYLLLELRSSSADHKAPSRQSSGARNDLSVPGSVVSLCMHVHTMCLMFQTAVIAELCARWLGVMQAQGASSCGACRSPALQGHPGPPPWTTSASW